MAQSIAPIYDQRVAERPVIGNSGFVVVDQAPSRTEAFPYRLQVNWILTFSIAKCIFGVLLFVTGIVNVVEVRYDTHIAFGIWCGLTIMGNGIIGVILKYKQNKCLIGAFLGLSITSLIFDISMLAFYAVVLEYFVSVRRYYCYYVYRGDPYYYGSEYCTTSISKSAKELGIGISAFFVSMVALELGCSIGSVIVSGKAYCKCCNTCDVNDCGTCLGCCECDCQPLNVRQRNQPNAPPAYNYQNFQMSSMQPGTFQPIPHQPQVNTNVQSQVTYNAQSVQSNPCSGIVSFIINMPSYMFGGANGTPISAVNVTVQPVAASQQIPGGEPARVAEQVQTTFIGGRDQNLPVST